ncbi:fimbria/pilus outer membrane usher protein [Brevundimonas sp.]|uniref:fimbria/pilus outer membrane usher protein n=1 Tax=Brevundimonas sp. TaxID=1871086 RepID=UPI003F727299
MLPIEEAIAATLAEAGAGPWFGAAEVVAVPGQQSAAFNAQLASTVAVSALLLAMTPAGLVLADPNFRGAIGDALRIPAAFLSDLAEPISQAVQAIAIPPSRPTVTTPPPSILAPPDTGRTDVVERPGRIEITMPLRIGTAYVGELTAGIGPENMVDLSRDRLLVLLEPLASRATLDKLRAMGETLTLADLQALGLGGVYDPALLEITIDLPVNDQQLRTIELSSELEAPTGRVERPARFSAWLTWRTALDYVHAGGSTGLARPVFDLTGAARVMGGVVVEVEAFVDTSLAAADMFRRRATRFVYDQPERARRWVLGDIRPDVRGFQSSPDMAGLSVTRSFGMLEPGRNIRPRGQGTFSLSQPGSVQFFVNGRPVRQMDLQPGRYDVRNFPFAAGQNNVQVVVEDPTGRRELFSYNRFFDQQLLEPGLAEYNLAVGIAAPFGNGQQDYRTDQFIATGYYRRGVTDSLTLGINGQANMNGGMVGAEALWSPALGVVSAQAAVSNFDGRTGWAAQLNYQWQSPTEEGPRQTFAASVEAVSPYFDSIGNANEFPTIGPGSVNPRAVDVSLAYSRQFGDRTVLNADAGYVVGREGGQSGARARLGFSRRLDRVSNLSVEAQYDQLDRRGNNYGVFLTYSRRLGAGQFFRASHDANQERSRLSYQRNPSRGYGGYSVAADVERAPGETSLNGSVFRTFNRLETNLSHRATFDETTGEVSNQRTSLRLAGAVAYADGAVAVGRPIYDSFAIVTRHSTLRGAQVLVDPTPDGGSQSRTDRLGPALVSEVSSYSRRNLPIEVEGADPGYDLGSGSFDLRAPYRAGYRLVVGSDYSVSLIGTLLDRDLQPVALLAGRAIDLSDPDHAPIELFTNRAGRFSAQGLRPGRWRIELGDGPLVYEFDVPEGETFIRLAQPLAPIGSGR